MVWPALAWTVSLPPAVTSLLTIVALTPPLPAALKTGASVGSSSGLAGTVQSPIWLIATETPMATPMPALGSKARPTASAAIFAVMVEVESASTVTAPALLTVLPETVATLLLLIVLVATAPAPERAMPPVPRPMPRPMEAATETASMVALWLDRTVTAPAVRSWPSTMPA